jgi:hypothetical protein
MSNNVQEYAKAVSSWMDSLVLIGVSGRRAVFVERSLRRMFRKQIRNIVDTKFVPFGIGPRSRYVREAGATDLDDWKIQSLWFITVNIAKKFKTEVPEEIKFRKTLSSI